MGYPPGMSPPITTDTASVIRAVLHRRSARQADPSTQTHLAHSVGLSWRQWQERMSGRVDWRLDDLRRIAAALEIDVADLATDYRPGGEA